MKHIFDDHQTQEYLQDWAGDSELCSASFFFWNSGSPEQKSYAGFLKALLFQILELCPDLIPVALPERCAPVYSYVIDPDNKRPPDSSWGLGELNRALRAHNPTKQTPSQDFHVG